MQKRTTKKPASKKEVKTELPVVIETGVVKSAATPDMLLAVAVEKGRSLEEISKLMDLQDRWLARIAESEFVKAKSQFKKDVPRISKNTNVNFPSKQPGGKNIDYNYADLGDIGEVIKDPLYRNGLDFDWTIDNTGQKIKVTCILTHIGGHKKTTTMEADADNSGSKNAIQSNGSTITYLERYTLKAVLGLTDTDKDVDGRLSKDNNDGVDAAPVENWTKIPTITQQQYQEVFKSVMKGTMTVDKVLKNFVISDDQEKALRVVEDSKTTTPIQTP